MAQHLIEYPDGLWAVDWNLIYRIVRSRHLAALQLQHATEANTAEWYEFWESDAYYIDVDWDQVRREVDQLTPLTINEIAQAAYRYGMTGQVRRVRSMIAETREAKEKFRQKIQATQLETMSSIESELQNAQAGQKIATWVRDGSFTIVTVIAAATLGPVASSAVNAATDSIVLLSDGKGDAGDAVLNFTGKFMIGCVGPKHFGGKYATLAVKSGMESSFAGVPASVQGNRSRIFDHVGEECVLGVDM